MKVIGTLEQRFWDRVDKTENCWDWIGGRQVSGYGVFGLGKRGNLSLAHRYSWELFNGPIPEKLHVLHKCDRPQCVNPDHLFVGNEKDNARDRVSKERKSPTELRKDSKLNWTKVFLIKLLWPLYSQSKLARMFGVGQHCILKVLHKETWVSNHASI